MRVAEVPRLGVEAQARVVYAKGLASRVQALRAPELSVSINFRVDGTKRRFVVSDRPRTEEGEDTRANGGSEGFGIVRDVRLSFIIIDPARMAPLVALRRTKKPGSARAGHLPRSRDQWAAELDNAIARDPSNRRAATKLAQAASRHS